MKIVPKPKLTVSQKRAYKKHCQQFYVGWDNRWALYERFLKTIEGSYIDVAGEISLPLPHKDVVLPACSGVFILAVEAAPEIVLDWFRQLKVRRCDEGDILIIHPLLWGDEGEESFMSFMERYREDVNWWKL